MELAVKKFLRRRRKEQLHFYKKAETKFTVMPNYFSEQKSLTKLNFKLLLSITSKGHIQEGEDHKDNLLTHIRKLNGKYQKKKLKF